MRVNCIFSLTSYVFWWFDCISLLFVDCLNHHIENQRLMDWHSNQQTWICLPTHIGTPMSFGLKMGEYCTIKCQQCGSSMLFKPSKNEKIWGFKMKFPQHWLFWIVGKAPMFHQCFFIRIKHVCHGLFHVFCPPSWQIFQPTTFAKICHEVSSPSQATNCVFGAWVAQQPSILFTISQSLPRCWNFTIKNGDFPL